MHHMKRAPVVVAKGALAATALAGWMVMAHAQTATAPAGAAPVGAAPAGINLNLGSVVSTAVRSGANVAPSATGTLRQAQQLKKLAPNIISVQPQSQIQKLPDVNIAEALQRVPGISMESDSGEGRFINIRGMDADLNGTTYDGVHLTASNQSTPSGGGRAVAFDAFPTGLVGGVEVTKSLTPDMNAEGLGGSVNLLPLKAPADGGTLANIDVAAGQEMLRNSGIYHGTVTLGQSFAIPGMRSFANPEPFSFLFNYTNESDRRGIDDVEEDYNSPTINNQPASLQDLQMRWYQYHRVRQGYAAEFDFDPDPQTHFYLRGLTGGYDEQVQKNRLELDGLDGSNVVDANGNVIGLTDNGGGNYTAQSATAQKVFTNSNERIGYDLIAFGGKSVIDDFVTVDARGSWVEGYDRTSRSYGTTFNADNNGNGYTINYSTADPKLRTFNVIDPTTGAAVNLSNPSLFTLNSVSNTPGRNQDQEFEGALDAAFPTEIFGSRGEAKFGGDIRLREEGAFQTETDYNTPLPLTLAQLSAGPSVVYYDNNYNIGPNVSYNALYKALGPATQNLDTLYASFAHNTENVYAAYGQETAQWGRLEILGGVRVEVTHGTYGAYASLTSPPSIPGNAVVLPDGSIFVPNTNKQNYVNVFPALQFKYAVSDQLQFRAAWSTGIARPGFQQISAAESVDYSTSPTSVTIGNANLKPTTGNSVDLTAEYYPNQGGLLSADVFYKLYDNYIVQTLNLNGSFQGRPAQVTSYENIAGAFARGLELDAQQKFYFLPGLLSGFGTDDNITFVDSRGRYDFGTSANNFTPEKAYQLPETSPISYNAALFYEKGPFQARVAAAYVSRNVFSVVGERDLDQFSQPRFRLDVSAAYQLTPRIQFYFEGKNLTNTRLEFTSSASMAYPIQREFYRQDFLAGVRLRLGS